MMFAISKVKELESTVEEQRNEINRIQDELRIIKPSNFSESEFILCYYACTVR